MILPWRWQDWPLDARDAFEELAGKIQHDGKGCSKEESERRAEPHIRSEWARVRTGAADVRQSQKRNGPPALAKGPFPKLPRHDSNMRHGD
jgi:hypothetical protein